MLLWSTAEHLLCQLLQSAYEVVVLLQPCVKLLCLDTPVGTCLHERWVQGSSGLVWESLQDLLARHHPACSQPKDALSALRRLS